MADVVSRGEQIAKGMQPPKSKEEHKERMASQMIQQAKDADTLFEMTGVETEILEASIESVNLMENKEFKAMIEEGKNKMNNAVEAAMKKFNIQPPGPPPGMGGMGGQQGPPPGMGGPPRPGY